MPPFNSPFIVPVVLFIALAVTAIGVPLARAFAPRIERGDQGQKVNQGASPDVIARLERMEQSIDAIAVEVERIAEGQRFTTKLLSERASAPLPSGRAGS